MLKIYNTLTRKIEEFEPLNPPHVGMYTCGPTVYDSMHIGNLRSFVFADILGRVLSYNDYQVKAVMNITDIDDKIINRAKEKGTSIEILAEEYTRYFLDDVHKLNVLPPTVMPKATEHVGKMTKHIKRLIEKGLAYEQKGSVYFDISKYEPYGRLSHIEKDKLKTGTRILSDQYAKDDAQDFSLWKAVGSSELGYPSPWGRGRPGWHIECSVMSQEYLGETFDIHVGGIDLIFPHHENEIAQSEGATGAKFANYFIHGAHMLVEGQKMSKSLKNFYTLRDVTDRDFSPLALRYLYFQTHYRQEMNFTWEGLRAAKRALNKLCEEVGTWDEPKIGCAEFEEKFLDAVNDDLNLPQALAIAWELVRSDYPSGAKAQSLFKFDKVLGLDFRQQTTSNQQQATIPEEVMQLVREREELRGQKRYHLSDQLRNKIKKLGYEVQDENGKTNIKKIA